MTFTPNVGRSVVDDATLQNVAFKAYTKDWVRLANKLDFEFEDIKEFKSKHRDPQSQVRQILDWLIDWLIGLLSRIGNISAI